MRFCCPKKRVSIKIFLKIEMQKIILTDAKKMLFKTFIAVVRFLNIFSINTW